MTDLEKQKILDLKSEGHGYKSIAVALSMSENTVKSFLRRINGPSDKSGTCKNCGKKLEMFEKRKPKTFCCDNCRIIFWRKNN